MTKNTKEDNKYFQWHLQPFTPVNPWAQAHDIFTDEEIEKIIEIGNSEETSVQTEGAVGLNRTIDENIRISNISWIRADLESQHWIFRKLTDVVNGMNQQFFKYDLVNIESLQFSRYDSNRKGMYKKHTDMYSQQSFYSRKLSFSLQLTDEDSYEGGDLCLYFQDDPVVASRKKGVMTFFPSYTLHEVTPVLKGVRYSLVGWVLGPKFI